MRRRAIAGHALPAPEGRASGRAVELGDFSTSPRVALISVMAVAIGLLSAFVAYALLRLIGLFTNLFFYQRWDSGLVSPAGHHLGPFVILVPVAGALIIGLMARYGSERIRGHGIPEAIEAILIRGSRVEPRVAILKPLSSAISIGSGGPFGAEGPIIMTGGALGSLIAQCFHLTGAERRTLLVAGAAGGMAATFAAPLSATVLSVELLLFEWKPRSFVPVALASAAAAAMRRGLLGPGPLFPTSTHPPVIGTTGLFACALAGILAGALSVLLTKAVYAAEDGFSRLRLHWMWWPALGGVVVGLGGFVFPRALGVGYDVIAGELRGALPIKVLLGVLVVKATIWAVSLGSGTSGGVLAPLLMLGGALGGLEALVLPHEGGGFWALVSMGAILGGTMRSPLTGIVFALELTHDISMVLPLLVAVVVAHAFTVLTMQRSILTEKVARRGHHLSREYAVDPLETVVVQDAMRTDAVALPGRLSRAALTRCLAQADSRTQALFPVVVGANELIAVATRRELHRLLHRPSTGRSLDIAGCATTDPVIATPDEPLRAVADRMAETGHTTLPVVAPGQHPLLIGQISLSDLLKARSLALAAEQRRERFLPPPRLLRRIPPPGAPSEDVEAGAADPASGPRTDVRTTDGEEGEMPSRCG